LTASILPNWPKIGPKFCAQNKIFRLKFECKHIIKTISNHKKVKELTKMPLFIAKSDSQLTILKYGEVKLGHPEVKFSCRTMSVN